MQDYNRRFQDNKKEAKEIVQHQCFPYEWFKHFSERGGEYNGGVALGCALCPCLGKGAVATLGCWPRP